MSDLRLRCRHRNPRRLPVKRELQGARLNSIVEQGGRAVEVYVVEIFRLATSVFEREAHRACWLVTIFGESHAMIRVARRAIADHFSVNLRAAIQRMPQLFKDINPRAFAKNDSGSIARERSRSAMWLIVPI